MNNQKKKPRGRPKSDNPASETIPRVRVTKDQLDAYKAAAKRTDMSFSAWVRSVLNKASN